MEQRRKSISATTPNRGRISSNKAMESPSPSPKPLVQSVKKQNSKVSRSLTLNTPKSRDDGVGGKKIREVSRTGKKFPSDSDGTKESQLQEKLCFAENLIKDLQNQLLVLKEELHKSQSYNDSLVRDLAFAEAKLAKAITNDQVQVQKISDEKDESIKRKPPPPPPPPQQRPTSRAVATQKSPDLIRLFHSLRNKEGKRDSQLLGKPAVINAHNSIVGEIQNRSAHLLAIKADIETKGEFINGLIEKVLVATYNDIEDVLKFVDWLDSQLSSLADERAVLKHFKWPESKADAMREAAIEYRALKLLEKEISLYKDDTNTPCEAALKKMASLLDKSERSIQRLIRLRNTVMHSYQDLKLPTNWMLDSGITSKIKEASMNLAKMYMKRVKRELDSIRSSDKESNQESLLLRGVNFAYRTHQFAGGLDSETLCAFEEIKQWVPRQELGGSHSQGLIVGIP